MRYAFPEVCVHYLCANTNRSLILHLSLVLAFVHPLFFDGRAAECADAHLAPLSVTIHTIRAIHSQHHTLFNSYKVVRSPPLRSHLLQYRRLMVLLLQELFPAHCSHAVQSAHKSLRIPPEMAHSDVMPVAEVITQLSLLDFLQRCGVSIAPLQQSRATSAHLTPTQMGSRSASLISVDVFVQTPKRSRVLHDGCHTTTAHGVLYWLHLLERSSGPPKLCSTVPAISTRSTCIVATSAGTRTARTAYRSCYRFSLVHYTRRFYCSWHLYELGYVQLFQICLHSPLLVPPMWDHIILVQPLQAREVPVPPWWERTILQLQILVQGLFLFLNRVFSFFLWSTLVNPNLKGTLVLIQLTAISCIINSVSPFYNGTQARCVNILLILFPQPVGSSMRLFYRKPVIMFRTSLISLWRSLATRTSLSCSTRILLSLTL